MSISVDEIRAAVAYAVEDREVDRLERLTGGIDFETYRVEFMRGDPLVFRGQRNHTSSYDGYLDHGVYLASEARFYQAVPDLPVPAVVHLEPDESRFGFPFAVHTYLPGTPLPELLTGIVDAANAIGGDPAFDLARADEGEGLSDAFMRGYHEDVGGCTDREAVNYLLYRLETAALLASVFEGFPAGRRKLDRLQRLSRAILARKGALSSDR